MGQKLTRNDQVSLSPLHKAFPYQGEAVDALVDLDYCAIFHEQGLGKTKIAIDMALIWLAKRTLDSVVVVTKKGLVENWVREVKAHSKLRPIVIGSNKAQNYAPFTRPGRIYITHYEAIISEAKRFSLFVSARNVAFILDESQKIKNPESNVAKKLFELAPKLARRVIMTGTPAANRVFDIWSQIYFLDSGKSLGTSFADFKTSHDLPSVCPEHFDAIAPLQTQNASPNDNMSAEERDAQRAINDFESKVSDLFGKISQFSIRETKKDSGLSLPTKEISHITANWEVHQLKLYNTYREELRETIKRDGVLVEDNADALVKRMLRLIQIASNPRTVDEDYLNTPGKLEVVAPLVNRIIEQQEKAIIWTSFTENVDWLCKYFSDLHPARVHGKISIRERQKAIDKFLTKEECKLFIATPGSAKEGLTLTVANHVVFYDRSFSLDDYLQAQDRIHRISQKKKCYIYNVIMNNSIDYWVDRLLEAKRLSAMLAQGDIEISDYQGMANYDYREVMLAALND